MKIENKTILITGANRGIGRAIFAGIEAEEEDIFPDPMSASMAEAWRAGAVKAMERQKAAFVATQPA